MGNLLGIEEEKEYFKKLNIESIYLNPIVESPETIDIQHLIISMLIHILVQMNNSKNFCKNFKNDNIKSYFRWCL